MVYQTDLGRGVSTAASAASTVEVRCIHDPASAGHDVLVINRGRLVVDGMVTEVLNAMKHSSYPYSSLETWR